MQLGRRSGIKKAKEPAKIIGKRGIIRGKDGGGE